MKKTSISTSLLAPARLLVAAFQNLGKEAYGAMRPPPWEWRDMVETRPPLPDEDFLRAVGAEEPEAPLWIEVRRVQADLCGVPREAIHPQDSLDDLWPADWFGPDRLDLVFRLERSLGVRIPIAAVRPILEDRTIREFGPLAARMVALIRRLRKSAE